VARQAPNCIKITLRGKVPLAIANSIAAQHEQARALEGLGLCHALEGNRSEGRKILSQALDVYQRIGSPRARELEEELRQPTAGSRPAGASRS